MPRLSYGPTVKARTLQVLQMLLDYANDNLEVGHIRDLDCHWQGEDDNQSRLLVRTTLRSLQQLSQEIHTPKSLTKAQIRDALRDYLDTFLGIVHDCRVHARGSENWHFELHLWSRETAENLTRASDLWDQLHPKNGNSIPAQEASTRPPLASERPRGVPFQVPPLPYCFVERPEHQNAVKQILLGDQANQPGTLVVSAICGLGGIGKSVLAVKLARDPEVWAKFPDGVLWTTLGQQPDMLGLLTGWIQDLGDYHYQPITETAASAHLRTLLADKRMLLVVDDVWNPEHAELFRVGSPECCVLITTRQARIPQAVKYSLDVMTPEQSLELITHKLSMTLDEASREQALTFAERVGYLPLALELAASQFEEGVTWSELLEDFQSEVARLESLDLYTQDDIPEDAKRRNFSLMACFQLSLKQLSAEQLRQFAWLGVVPEDVTLTQEMAMTLWQVPQRVAGAILRTFSSKSLLSQGSRQCGQRPTYRMHDLMHDLAQKLLTAPEAPTEEGSLSGLGLTKVKAHGELIERYRQKTQNGQWHTVPNDDYIHAHLTWHLEQAEQFNEIHQLLQEETPEGRNGWYEACVTVDQSANFVTDVGRAWNLAKELYGHSPAQAIALQCRYGLINASLNSLVINFPPDLIEVLVEIGEWSPAQGLAHIQKIKQPWLQLDSIEKLIPYLPNSLLEEALIVARSIQDKNYQDMAICHLSVRLPNLKSEAKKIAETTKDPYCKVIALWSLAVQDEAFWNRVLCVLPDVRTQNQRAVLIKKLSANIPNNYLHNLLAISRDLTDIYSLAKALGAIATRIPSLRAEIREIILPQIFSAQDIYMKAKALGHLSKICPEVWPEIVNLMTQIRHEHAELNVFEEQIAYIPNFLLNEIINISRDFKNEYCKATALGKLSAKVRELWKEALDATKLIGFKGLMIYVISDFSSCVKSALPLAMESLSELEKNYDKAISFCGLSSVDNKFQKASLNAIQEISDAYYKISAFGYYPFQLLNLWPEIYESLQQIQGAFYKISALERLLENESVRNESEFWIVTLDTIQTLWFEWQQAERLYYLSHLIPGIHIPKAIEIAQSIQSEPDRLLALSPFSSRSSEIQLTIHHALESSDFSKYDEHYFPLILGGLALESPTFWPKVLRAIHSIESEGSKPRVFLNIASKIPSDFIRQALEISLDIKGEFYKANALFSLLPCINLEMVDYDILCKILFSLSHHNRYVFLTSLPRLTQKILELGSEDALVETAHAIRDVCRQWQ